MKLILYYPLIIFFFSGVIITNGKLVGDKEYWTILNNDQFSQDSNKTITILMKVFKSFQDRFGFLPRNLYIQTDNCVKDLKNQNLLSFYFLLVLKKIFDEVTVTSMPVGHTHNDVDWLFSVIAGKLLKLEIPSFEELKSELLKIQINDKSLNVLELTHTYDFKTFIEDGHLLKIEGHKQFSQFVIRRENEDTKLYLKLDELDNSFKFPNGINLLKNIPNVIKLKASPFRTDTRYHEIFNQVIYKYIPSLAGKYTEEEIDKIKNDWEKRMLMLIDLSQNSFEPLIFEDLKPQQILPVRRKDSVEESDFQSREKDVSVKATFYPLELQDFRACELKKGVNLVIYSSSKTSRPWMGVFLSLSDDANVIELQWLKKEKSRQNQYVLHFNGKEPYVSLVPVKSVMFSNVLENLSPSDGMEGPYRLSKTTKISIEKAYQDQDRNSYV